MTQMTRKDVDFDELWEPVEANPDVLTDEDTLFHPHTVKQKHLMEKIRKAVDKLPLQQREVIRYFLDGFSLHKTAKILKISKGTAQKHKARAIHTLQIMLKE